MDKIIEIKIWGRPGLKTIMCDINETGCYLCTSRFIDANGYCHVGVNGKSIYLHRYIYELNFGEIPKGLVVRHKCDNRNCINSEHLEVGTYKDNTQDMIKRNRGRWQQHEVLGV